MFGSSMLDIAIGIVFVFLLLSLFASTINELILSLISLRGKELLRGIQTLLDDDSVNGLVQKVYTHGQVYGLYVGSFDLKKRRSLPSYIPSGNFALALLDSVAQPFSESAPQAPPAQQGPAGQINAVVRQAPIITQTFKDAAKALADNEATSKVGKPLLSMIDMASNDAATLQKSVEDWYNSGMDRVSGWYKYKTQLFLFWIGLIIAISLNADTIGIVKQLSKDSTLRQSIVAAAQSAKPVDKNTDNDIAKNIGAATQSFNTINNLGLPIGWPELKTQPEHLYQRLCGYGALTLDQPSMMLGWFLTAIAISLGAPFWFDALNKIMVVRSTVKPREKSPDEASKS